MADDGVKYEVAQKELKEVYGVDVTIEELKDLDFVTKLIGKYGYSVSYSTINEQVYTEKRADNNLDPDPEFLAAVRENVHFYTYQLYGRQYTSRGSHPSPLCPTLQQCALTALYNVIRLLPDDTPN